MANVTIDGFSPTVPKWATEPIQREIRDLMQTQVQYLTKDEIGRRRDFDSLGNKVKGAIDKNQKSLISGLKELPNAFVKSVIVGGASFETALKRFAQAVSTAILSIPKFGIILAPFVVLFSKLIDVIQLSLSAFAELYDQGVTLNGSFITLIQVAGNARLSIMDLVDALKNHSESIVRMSTGNLKGVAAFGALYESVRDNIRINDFYGMSIADTTEFLGQYLETQKIIGSLQKIDEIKRGAAVASYIKEINRLAHFTGKRRKQIQAEIEEVMRKESIAAALAGMSAEAQIEARKFLGLASSYGPTALQAAQEIILTGATGFSEGTKGLSALLPDVVIAMQDMWKNIKSGNKLTVDEQAKFVGLYNKLGTDLIKAHGPSLGYAISINDMLRSGFEGALRAQNFTEENFRKDLAFQEGLSKIYMNWEQIWQDFMSRFTDTAAGLLKVVQKGGYLDIVFGNLQRLLETVNTYLEGWANQETMEKFFTSIINFAELLTAWINGADVKPFEGITDIFDGMAKSIVELFEYYLDVAIGNITNGVLGTEKSKKDWLQDRRHEENANMRRRIQLGFGSGGKESRMDSAARSKDPDKAWEFYLLQQRAMKKNAKGGIARVPSIFGEAGPEVVIPLISGDKIPIAEVKRPAAEMQTFDDIRSLLEDIKERLEYQVTETVTQSTTLKQIERKTGRDPSRIF